MVSNTGGLPALLESRYLDREVTGYSLSTIQVNPLHSLYVAGKTIIINIPDYPVEDIETLVGNGNIVVSRIPCEVPGVIIKPYLPRLCMGIMWNGNYQDHLSDREIDKIEFDFVDGVLLVPKGKSYEYTPGSFLEYMAYQTGAINYPETKFKDLDIVKTGKGFFPGKLEKRRFRTS